MIINDLLSQDTDCSVKGFLIEEVKTFFHVFTKVICTYASRKCNQATHVLARNLFLFPAFQVWVEDEPQWLSNILIADVNI